MVYDGREHRRLRIFLDYMMITGTLSILLIGFYSLWIMLPVLFLRVYIMDLDLKPIPKTVKRLHKKSGKYLEYEIDEKTGKYIKKSRKGGERNE